MFLREKRINKQGTIYTYLNLVESVREKGKIKQKILLNFGNIDHWPPERLKKLSDDLAMYAGESAAIRVPEDTVDPELALNYGPFLLADIVWQRLKLSEFWQNILSTRSLEFEVEMAIKVMVFNRLTSPRSKLSLDEWSDEQYIPGVNSSKLKVHHYYRALDVLEDTKDQFEKWVYDHITDLLNFDLSLVFYDLTSTYFEGNGPANLAHFGYSRDHRPDCKQIQIGLLVNSDGIPISHLVFNGKVRDLKTLPNIISTMTKRFTIKECIFVADDGILNISTLQGIQEAGYQFICSTRMHKENFAKELMSKIPPVNEDSSPWIKVKENLWIYEYPGKIEGHRICVTFNPLRRDSSVKKRQRHLQESIAYLNSFKENTKRGAQKNNQKVESQIDTWLTQKGTRKYFTFHREGPFHLQYSLLTPVVEESESLDGIMILRSDSDTLSTENIARGYRTLTQVENAFKEIKNFIRLRPIRHYNDIRVKGHVAVCVIAYLIESVLDTMFSQSRIKITARKALDKLSPLKVVKLNLAGKTIYKTTSPKEEQLELLKAVGYSKFDRILV
jgi:hypothetical protein